MTKPVADILFQTHDVFGKQVRITRQYWNKITQEKHRELTASREMVINALELPDYVHQSIQDTFIKLFYRTINSHTLVVVVKYLQDIAFVITVYETSKLKRKGEQLWPK